MRKAHALARAARHLVVVLPLLLGGCGPAIIAGIVVLLATAKDDSSCSIQGDPVEVSLSGTVSFQKRPRDPRSGPAAMEPLPRARVEVLRLNCGEEVIGNGETDGEGGYSIGVTTPSGSVLRVVALAESADPEAPVVVRDNIAERNLYSFESPSLTLTGDPSQAYTVNIDIPMDCEAQPAGAFNLLAQVRLGFLAIAGVFPPPERPLTIFWEIGDPDGTYFTLAARDLDGDGQGGDPYIQIRGGVSAAGCHNTDQFDDSLIVHEFGHFVAYLHSRDDSPGGPHAVAELLDPRLAWSEGWADFFSAMAREDPLIYDTYEDIRACSWGCSYYEFNIEEKDGLCVFTACCQGIGSEEAVGGFLWNLLDPVSPPLDEVQAAREDMLLAFESLRERRFVYVGDFVEEIEARLPAQRDAIRAIATQEDFTDPGGELTPFPSRFDTESVHGESLQAAASGAVNGCDESLCKQFVENYIGSSDFLEVLIPGPPGRSGTLTANLSITPLGTGCSPDLQLRIYNQAQTYYYSTEGLPGLQKSIRINLDAEFSRGSYLLFEVAGDEPLPPDERHGQKALYNLTVDVQ